MGGDGAAASLTLSNVKSHLQASAGGRLVATGCWRRAGQERKLLFDMLSIFSCTCCSSLPLSCAQRPQKYRLKEQKRREADAEAAGRSSTSLATPSGHSGGRAGGAAHAMHGVPPVAAALRGSPGLNTLSPGMVPMDAIGSGGRRVSHGWVGRLGRVWQRCALADALLLRAGSDLYCLNRPEPHPQLPAQPGAGLQPSLALPPLPSASARPEALAGSSLDLAPFNVAPPPLAIEHLGEEVPFADEQLGRQAAAWRHKQQVLAAQAAALQQAAGPPSQPQQLALILLQVGARGGERARGCFAGTGGRGWEGCKQRRGELFATLLCRQPRLPKCT